MVHEPRSGGALEQRHVERLEDDFGLQGVGERPADDLAAEGVDHDRRIEPALPGGVLGDVGHPQHVRLARPEAALDEVVGERRLVGGAPHALRTPAVGADEACFSHEASHALLRAADALAQLSSFKTLGAP